MSSTPSQDDSQEHALLSIMTLLATVNAASEVGRYVRERRAGQDPSEQEEDRVVLPALRTSMGQLRELTLQLRTSLLFYAEHDASALFARARRFLDVMRLKQVNRELQQTHQRLLSLYPAVSETLAENARELMVEASSVAHAEAGDFMAHLGHFADAVSHFISALEAEITSF